MTEKFTINHNDPYFGCVTLTNPEDRVKNNVTSYAKYTTYCAECANLNKALVAERNASAAAAIRDSQALESLKYQLARVKNDLAVVEQMHRTQAATIIEQAEEITSLKNRNLDPEPHALKAAILVMQKQLDALSVALDKAKKDHDDCDADWRRAYHSVQQSHDAYLQRFKNRIKELEKKLAENEANNFICHCDDEFECDCDTLDGLREDKHNLQRRIEEQNRQLGAKQEEINNLKVALSKAKAKQTFEVKPAEEIIRSYDDKIRRLLNVINSKDEIIAGLQNDLRNDRG